MTVQSELRALLKDWYRRENPDDVARIRDLLVQLDALSSKRRALADRLLAWAAAECSLDWDPGDREWLAERLPKTLHAAGGSSS